MFEKAALAVLAAGVAIGGLAVPASATEPTTGGGAFTLVSAVTTGSQSADGNLFIKQIQTYDDTGVLTGVETDLVKIVFHPDGTFNATGTYISSAWSHVARVLSSCSSRRRATRSACRASYKL